MLFDEFSKLLFADAERLNPIANLMLFVQADTAAILTDITRRRQTERRLEDEEALREQIIASLPDPLVTFTRECKFTFLSTRAEMTFGYDRDYLFGGSLIDCVDPQDEMALYTLVSDAVTDPGTVCSRELRMRVSGDGDWHRFVVRAAALQDGEGSVHGVVASLRDCLGGAAFAGAADRQRTACQSVR